MKKQETSWHLKRENEIIAQYARRRGLQRFKLLSLLVEINHPEHIKQHKKDHATYRD